MKTLSVIGISIGGTKTAVVHATFDGTFKDINKIVFPSNPNEPNQEMNDIFDAIKKINYPVDAISVITGGPQDTRKGLMLKPPHLPGFDNFPIVDILKEKYKCDVYYLNDADACALAEFKFGAGKGYNNIAYLTFGTGFGAGLVLNGKLYTGHNGMAGEIGHIKLSENGPIGYNKKGSVEGYVAGGNISKWAKDFIKNKETSLNNYKELTTKDIAFEANNGDKAALEIFDIVSSKLGETISILIDLLNLDAIVIGGIYPRCLNLIEEKVKLSAKNSSILPNYEAVKILPSLLNEQIDDYSSLVGILLGENMKTFYERYPELLSQKDNIESAIDTLSACYKNGGKILVCGNGGSSSDSAHIVGELMKSFITKRPLADSLAKKINHEFNDDIATKLQTGIPCIDLTAQSALVTAFANDVDPNFIFAQQVLAYSSHNPYDVVIGLSTSGNSKNVVNAIKVAKSLGLKTIALTGKEESLLSKVSTICIKAPEKETFKIQEYHLPIYHYICSELEKRI